MPTDRKQENDFKVVAVGGGHGLPIALKSIQKYSQNITAIATVADDGGSSGRLRRELAVLPPGDSRNCLVALADDNLISRLFQYRFTCGEGMAGHALGNLIIAALSELTGDFSTALAEAGKLLKAKGKVLPPTDEKVTLCARLEPEGTIRGQCNVANRLRSLVSIWLEPTNSRANEEAVAAIKAADQIIIGPGSLFTSIFPNLLVSGIRDAIEGSKAQRIFICNTMVQAGETDGFTAEQHITAIFKYIGRGLIDTAIINQSSFSSQHLSELAKINVTPVAAGENNLAELDMEVIFADLADQDYPAHHDVNKLARVLSGQADKI
ncbi:MAG TPA: uridine diphosphate-N-acetylglucosamine-binding protein YvcK [Actinobacteria bacterium]|nr:uridine diphosphate-N-acetylglucosamine-binding protein YvcK [Actinomycetes bacterium]HEX21471.1 uridine diphosphate-N-acetylglucosamine-binding protein YvcK [Actinomycetota bacterium]